MSVSTITQVADEYIVQSLASFDRSGVMYVVWTAVLGVQSGFYWKPHTGVDGTEIQGLLSTTGSTYHTNVTNITVGYRPSTDTLTLVFDTDTGPGSVSSIYQVTFQTLTGVLLNTPTLIGLGFRPRIQYRGGVSGDRMILTYANRSTNTIYMRESENGGLTWTAERPIISNLIEGVTSVHAVPYDDEHMSVLTLGTDPKPIQEVVSFTHTRPWTSLVKHPSLADSWFVNEPSQNSSSGLADNLRGALIIPPGSSTLFATDGKTLGSSDGTGSVALLTTSGNTITVSNSVTPTPSAAGQDIVALTTTPAVSHVTNVLSSGPILASLAATSSYIYGAAYSDTPGSDGALVVYQIASQSFASIASVTNGHAAGAGMPTTGAAVICFGTTESGVEKLRIYTENGLTPTLQNTHSMPARVNAISVVLTSATTGTLYVSMVDRLNIYILNGLTSPIRLSLNIPLLSRGQFFQTALSPVGNIVAAMGKGGVGVFDTTGRALAEVVLSGLNYQPWGPGLGTVTLGQGCVPTPQSFYSPQRTWFKATTAGTSAVNEPYWAPAGNSVPDGTAVWQEQGDIQSVITGVAVDSSRSRIYAVGLVGGNTGTMGRFYAVSAPGVL